jgi:fimbrial chaperone protein
MRTAGAFDVAPLRVNIDNADDIEVVRITNPREFQVTYSVKAFRWMTSSSIADLQPTDDLLVVPPVFSVEAGQQQIIRVAARHWDGEGRERAYRIVIDEVASQVEPDKSIDFNFSITMPVFVAPETARAEPAWSLELDQEEGTKLIVQNLGTAHLAFDDLKLVPNSAAKPIFSIPIGGPIFPGERRSWPLNVALSDLKGPLYLAAGTDRGPIEAMVKLPDR